MGHVRTPLPHLGGQVGRQAASDGSACGVISWLGNSNTSGKSLHHRPPAPSARGPQAQLTSHCPPEDAAGGSEVVGATGGVGVHPLAEECQVLHWEEGRVCEASRVLRQMVTPSNAAHNLTSEGVFRNSD